MVTVISYSKTSKNHFLNHILTFYRLFATELYEIIISAYAEQ